MLLPRAVLVPVVPTSAQYQSRFTCTVFLSNNQYLFGLQDPCWRWILSPLRSLLIIKKLLCYLYLQGSTICSVYFLRPSAASKTLACGSTSWKKSTSETNKYVFALFLFKPFAEPLQLNRWRSTAKTTAYLKIRRNAKSVSIAFVKLCRIFLVRAMKSKEFLGPTSVDWQLHFYDLSPTWNSLPLYTWLGRLAQILSLLASNKL